jgi:two-component system osmolarity sensor histidine kinase EnvZ
MSSAPIDNAGLPPRPHGNDTDADQAEVLRQAAGTMEGRGLLRRLLPRTLFGRSMLIIATPAVLVHIVATYVFFESHWSVLSNRLAVGLASEIAMVIAYSERAQDPQSRQRLLDVTRDTLGLRVAWMPQALLPARPDEQEDDIVEGRLSDALTDEVRRPHTVLADSGAETVTVEVQLPDGVMVFIAPLSRLFSSTTYVFVLWMAGTALVLFAVALIFMRNQIRPIRRLADAADRLGKGLDVPRFKIEGALEVRQAALAFLRMRERLRRQVAQRTEMLAGVSHDLRTPLTRMKLELAMMGDEPGIDELRQDVAEMEHMISGYLAFARGEGSEEAAAVNLSDLLDEIATDARRAGTLLWLEPAETIEVAVRPKALKRCIVNLVTNAAKFGNHVWLSMVVGEVAVDIIVDDDGPGIPTDKRREVFRAFSRLERSRNPDTGGVGLGLTIARDIARTHGGDILLSESPRGGLRATVRLPL